MHYPFLCEKLAGKSPDAKLEDCKIVINDGLAKVEEARRSNDEHTEAVEAAWRYIEVQAAQGLIASDAVTAWQTDLTHLHSDAISLVRARGSSLRLRLESINEAIKQHWDQHGTWDLVVALETLQSLSLYLTEKILTLARRIPFDVAKARLGQQLKQRLREAPDICPQLTIRDVKAVLNMSSSTQRTRKRRRPLDTAYRPSVQRATQNSSNLELRNPAPSLQYQDVRAMVRADENASVPEASLVMEFERHESLSGGDNSERDIEAARGRRTPLSDYTEHGRCTSVFSPSDADPDRAFTPVFEAHAHTSLSSPAGNEISRRDIGAQPGNSSDGNDDLSVSQPEGFDDPRESVTTKIRVPDFSDTVTAENDKRDNFNLSRSSNELPSVISQTAADTQLRRSYVPDGKVPPNTVDGALSSLQAATWLSSTALQLILDMIYSLSDLYLLLLDPSFLSVQDADRSLSKRSVLRLGVYDNILVPMNYGSHWTICMVDVVTRTMEWYNPSPSARATDQARTTFDAFGRFLARCDGAYDERSWKFEPESVPQQENQYDCGVYCLVWALARVFKCPVPPRVDGRFWRSVFRTMLDPNLEPIAVAKASSTIVQPIDPIDSDVSGASDISDISQRECHRLNYLLSKIKSELQELQSRHDALETQRLDLQESLNLLVQANKKLEASHGRISQDYTSLKLQSKAYWRINEIASSDIAVGRDLLDQGIESGVQEIKTEIYNVEARLNELQESRRRWDKAIRHGQAKALGIVQSQKDIQSSLSSRKVAIKELCNQYREMSESLTSLID